MKLTAAAAAFVALAARMSLVSAAETSEFDEILSLVADLRLEVEALQSLYSSQQAEIDTLKESCCQATATPMSTEPAPTPIPTEEVPEAVPTPAPDVETPSPIVAETHEPTPSPVGEVEEATTAPTGAEVEPNDGGGGAVWTPKVGQHWNYNLATPVDTDVKVDVVALSADGYEQDTIDLLHSQGKGVICYISIGTCEDWREDATEFPESALGYEVDGWAGERWIDINDETVRSIMAERVKKAASMGCDAIETDNMMSYTQGDIGFPINEGQQIDYNSWFAGECHNNGMLVGMKNAVELVPLLYMEFDFAINESCFDYDECEVYEGTFLKSGKPVFNVQYRSNMDYCDKANEMKIDSIVKNLNLKAPLCSCSDSSLDVDCNSVV